MTEMISITPLTGTIGADVHGVDLTKPLAGGSIGLIRQALLDHLVLFFREQSLMTVEQHRALANCFGELEIAPFKRPDGDPTLLMIDQVDPRGSPGAQFHADNTFRPYPPMGAFLQARILPERGGDTCFASMYAAYEGLSERLRAYLDGLEASHSLEQMVARLGGSTRLAIKLEDWPQTRHPVIAIHPETGRKLLNVNYNWTTHIVGIPEAESQMLLNFLFEHVRRPQYQVRNRWNVGDVAFWDNRVTQHCAVADYQGRRLMQRIAIAGSPEPCASAERSLAEVAVGRSAQG